MAVVILGANGLANTNLSIHDLSQIKIVFIGTNNTSDRSNNLSIDHIFVPDIMISNSCENPAPLFINPRFHKSICRRERKQNQQRVPKKQIHLKHQQKKIKRYTIVQPRTR